MFICTGIINWSGGIVFGLFSSATNLDPMINSYEAVRARSPSSAREQLRV
jgi:hypothetical protein